MPASVRLAAVFAVAAATAFAQPAGAQDRGEPTPPQVPEIVQPPLSNASRPLSASELRACAKLAIKAYAAEAEVRALSPDLKARMGPLEDDGRQVKAEAVALDHADAAAVAALDAKAAAWSERREAFKRDSLRFDAALDTWVATSNKIATDCTLRPFEDTDFNALPPDLKAIVGKDKRPISQTAPARR